MMPPLNMTRPSRGVVPFQSASTPSFLTTDVKQFNVPV